MLVSSQMNKSKRNVDIAGVGRRARRFVREIRQTKLLEARKLSNERHHRSLSGECPALEFVPRLGGRSPNERQQPKPHPSRGWLLCDRNQRLLWESAR